MADNSINGLLAQFEDFLDVASKPIKPYLPSIARFLLVVTFLEDSLRIVTQWSDQTYFLSKYRGFPYLTGEAFLIVNVLTMLSCSILAVSKMHTEYACAGLAFVVISQAIGYGLVFDLKFFARNISVIGGLLMLCADSSLSKRKKLFAGLPNVNENEKSAYILLAGRILLVFLFAGFAFGGELSPLRIFVTAVSAVGCVMVVLGFKAKWSAWILITFLSISNVLLNNWWSLHHTHPQKDFQKYDFFQTLSVVGGFLLLVNLGPGGISMDEKKKSF